MCAYVCARCCCIRFAAGTASRIEFSVLKSGEQAFIIIADSPMKFWCQLTACSAELEKLSEEMTALCASEGMCPVRADQPSVGEACAAFFTVDELWYRAVVTGVADDGRYEILLVDYGNELVVGREHLLPLPARLCSLPAQAVRCSLYGVVPHNGGAWTRPALDFFQATALEQTVVAAVHEQQPSDFGSRHIVAITTDQDVDVALALVESGFADLTRQGVVSGSESSPVHPEAPQEVDTAVKVVDLPPALVEFTQQPPSVGQTVSVVLAYAASPDQLWFQPVVGSEQLEELGQGLADFYGTLAETEHMLPKAHCAAGSPCVAQYSDDGSWYRARILAVNADKATVRFVDYGNVAMTPLTQLKTMHADFADLPVQAFWFSLAGIGPADPTGEWSPEATERIQQLIASDVARAHVLRAQNVHEDGSRSFEVWLSNDNDQDVGRQLINEGLALQAGDLPPVEEPDVVVVEEVGGSSSSEESGIKQMSGRASPAVQSGSPDESDSKGSEKAVSDASQPCSATPSSSSPAPQQLTPSPTERVASPAAVVSSAASSAEPVETGDKSVAARDALIIGGKFPVSICHSVSPADFWCQLPGNQVALDRVMDCLNTDLLKPLEQITISTLCCCCFTEDGR